MANEDSTNNKSSSNLKVPPLKIVLSSHQNNTVVNISSSVDDSQFKSSNDKDDNSNDHLDEELKNGGGGRRNGLEGSDNSEKHHHKKNSKSSSERNDPESGQTSSRTAVFSSSSSPSSSSDRSASTTPSSESESLASNSTIISDQQQQQVKDKSEIKEDSSSTTNRHERVPRYGVKASSSERSSNSSTNLGKKSHDNTDQNIDTATPSSKEQHLNANQRITRSSQRAAQQSKFENPSELTQGDETVASSENPEKIHESARKAKRRKGEVQDGDQDSAQTAAQLTVTMANIYPADYQLPSQNSFELYRDIRYRQWIKLMKLNQIEPKVPYGFKEYLLNGGPYLLDGNKVGVGLNGSKYYETLNKNASRDKASVEARWGPLRRKIFKLDQRSSSYQPSIQRHTSYAIPKVAEAPKNLQIGSPLYELFQDQEKARQQMRMQHLKERERSILAAEQEILRAYTNAAIGGQRQKLHLSACTYFFLRDRYHYLDEKSGPNGNSGSKEVPHSQDNSFLCIEGGDAPTNKASESGSPSSKDSKSSPGGGTKNNAGENKSTKEKNLKDSDSSATSNSKELGQQQIKKDTSTCDSSAVKMDIVEKPTTITTATNTAEEAKCKNGQKESQSTTNGSKSDSKDSNSSDLDDLILTLKNRREKRESDKNDDQQKSSDGDSDNSISEPSEDNEHPTKNMSNEDLKAFNNEVFLNQLQEIDDKWDKIKRDMLVRHKNEADSLHAVQSLEWEWKAKEIGACDVRVSLKIEPEFVPRVEVLALDY